MKKRILVMTFIACLTLVAFYACKKNNAAIDSLDADSQTEATDGAEADKTFSDAFNVSVDAMQNHGTLYKTAETENMLLTDCAVLTWDNPADSANLTKFPKAVTVTFSNAAGTDSCLGRDGRYRKGKIHIKVENAKFREKGSKTTITFENFSVDGNKIEGTKTITNQGLNAAGHLVYDVNVTGGKITRPNGKVHTWTTSRSNEVVYKGSTYVVDYVLVTGTASGTAANGRNYTLNITKALKLAPLCRWIESGTIEITPSGKLVRTIDYGNGNCDRLASITIAGKSYQFEMR